MPLKSKGTIPTHRVNTTPVRHDTATTSTARTGTSSAVKKPQNNSQFEVRNQTLADVTKLGENFERRFVGRNKPGDLVDLHLGDPQKGLAVGIHGINGSPRHMAPLSHQSIQDNKTTMTYAYDDNFRRLTKTSQEFAAGLDNWMEHNPGKPVQLDAHSMGTRVTLSALQQLHEQGKLEGREVNVNLIAPPLTGLDAANSARFAPPGLRWIKNVRPGKDMGSNSDFQNKLDQIQLPNNVNVRVFLGGKDDIVSPEYAQKGEFQQLVQQLNADVVQFPNATHMTVLDEAARWIKNQ